MIIIDWQLRIFPIWDRWIGYIGWELEGDLYYRKKINMEKCIIATTGHRKLSTSAIVRAKGLVEYARTNNCLILNGGAEGWDQYVLGFAIEKSVPYELYLPFETSKKKLNKTMLEKAEVVHIETDKWRTWTDNRVYLKRDEKMVDRAEEVHSYWDGRQKGGTFHTVNYAKRKKKPLINWFE